jgi:HTH-type transcriptional regulator/antitoxin HigA
MKAAADNTLRLSALAPAWEKLRKATPYFGPIRSERDYARMNKLMNTILEEVGDDESHELADLLDVVSTLVGEYEARHHRWSSVEPREVLKYLMEQHDLKQTDLTGDLGTQSVVSEILAGKRGINIRQAKALAKRFHVSPAAFI